MKLGARHVPKAQTDSTGTSFTGCHCNDSTEAADVALTLYLVEGLAWWDWPFTWWTDQLLSFSAWHCRLGHLTDKKSSSDNTYNVFVGTLNPTLLLLCWWSHSVFTVIFTLTEARCSFERRRKFVAGSATLQQLSSSSWPCSQSSLESLPHVDALVQLSF